MVLNVVTLPSSLLKVCDLDSSLNPGMHHLCLGIYLSMLCVPPKEHTYLGSWDVVWFMYQELNPISDFEDSDQAFILAGEREVI